MQVADSASLVPNRTRRLGLVGAAAQLGIALLFGGLAGSRGAFPSPPEPIPRGLALGLLFALPAILGFIGAVSRDRATLAATAVLAAAGSVIAFSGVTIVLLIPALLFASAAGQGDGDRARPQRPWVVTVIVGVLGSVAMVLAALTIGILVLPLVVIGVLGLSLARVRRVPSTGSAAVVVVIVAAGIGAGWALFGMTETRCWEARQTSRGVEYVTVPESTTLGPISGQTIAGGCDGGAFRPQGAGIAAILGVGAIGVAALRAST